MLDITVMDPQQVLKALGKKVFTQRENLAVILLLKTVKACGPRYQGKTSCEKGYYYKLFLIVA
jgi:hypothetical protein